MGASPRKKGGSQSPSFKRFLLTRRPRTSSLALLALVFFVLLAYYQSLTGDDERRRQHETAPPAAAAAAQQPSHSGPLLAAGRVHAAGQSSSLNGATAFAVGGASADAGADTAHVEISKRELTVRPYWLDKKNESDASPRVKDYAYALTDNETWTLRADCGVPAATAARFDAAFERWLATHARIVAGDAPAAFVHVGIPHKSSFYNRLKVTVSTVMLAFVTGRAALISWTQALDTQSVYRFHRHVDDLFEPPPFNWTYDYARYQRDAWDRFNVTGFGLEEYVEQEPLHRLFCSDITAHYAHTTWWEVHWRYGWYGALLYHSPYLHRLVAPLFAKDDMFGPLARRLFTPLPHIAERIRYFRRTHFHGYRVVGVELAPGGGATQLAAVLAAVNRDVATRRDEWRAHAAADRADGGTLVKARRTKVFVVQHDDAAMQSVLARYGDRFQLTYYPHRNFSQPGDAGELIDLWLLGACDVLYATPHTVTPVGAVFSRRVRVVALDRTDKQAVADPQCQPCLSLNGVAKTTCFDRRMGFPEPFYKCEREYPIF